MKLILITLAFFSITLGSLSATEQHILPIKNKFQLKTINVMDNSISYVEGRKLYLNMSRAKIIDADIYFETNKGEIIQAEFVRYDKRGIYLFNLNSDNSLDAIILCGTSDEHMSEMQGYAGQAAMDAASCAMELAMANFEAAMGNIPGAVIECEIAAMDAQKAIENTQRAIEAYGNYRDACSRESSGYSNSDGACPNPPQCNSN